MVAFVKTCDQYPYEFNFGNLFSSFIAFPSSSRQQKGPIFKNLYLGEISNLPLSGGYDQNHGESFAWGHE